YCICIEPQLYHSAAKNIKKPKITQEQFGFNFSTTSIDSFNQEIIRVEEPPRATVLQDLIFKQFVTPLRSVFEQLFHQGLFLSADELKSFKGLHEYRTS